FLAPQWLISCDKTDNACDGGNPGRAGYYFMSHGTTTDDCFPYVSGDGEFIPDCPSTCDDGSTPELYYASDVIRLEGEEQMMDSIHANGPIVVGFVVYEDFEAYTSGIYEHVWGSQIGGHAVEIIGWGIENDTKYWTVKNSWGADWGEEGLFRIVRGVNECKIESMDAFEYIALTDTRGRGRKIIKEPITWKRGETKFSNWTDEEFASLMLRHQPERMYGLPYLQITPRNDLPDSFDARDQWPSCPSIGRIRDQGNCGSCWAFAGSETLSDKFCIESDAKTSVNLSAQMLVSCDRGNFGCHGGSLDISWMYMVNNGLPTEDCVAYAQETYDDGVVPSCPATCDDGSSLEMYYALHHANILGVDEMMTHLYEEGPLEVAMICYSDLKDYVSGIYQHEYGHLTGLHAVKIIGYGSEDGVDYWTVANSWGADWGEEGFFRIVKGQEECDIEVDVVCGFADV
ncbi:hypothetical protein ADUPG1_012991, partial [Aduncisulcus paluster]